MKVDPTVEAQITKMFAPLKNVPGNTSPAIGSLSLQLSVLAPDKTVVTGTHNLTPSQARMFSTAAVNMWLRSVHSFLVSTGLTEMSPIWASVSGYYSSHYSIRALAHALGFFHLFGAKRNVQVSTSGNHYVATFNKKKAGDREHHIYWTVVKASPQFSSDPFFTNNDGDRDPSDVRHRDRANYADHLPQFPAFQPLDRGQILERVQRISDIEITSPPIPRADRYPDIESVQVIAYHRLVRFRELLDEVLGDSNRYWNVSRNPPWAREFIDFQLAEADTTGIR